MSSPSFYSLALDTPFRSSSVLTSNRDPSEWLGTMADPLLAQSTVDRLKSAAWGLVIEGKSYRQHEKPTLETDPTGDTQPPGPVGARRSVCGAPRPSERALFRLATAHFRTRALDTESVQLDHPLSWQKWTRCGPMLLATRWSLKAGKRQSIHPQPRTANIDGPPAARIHLLAGSLLACALPWRVHTARLRA